MGRNATLEHARLLAACGIVVFHTGAPGATLGYAALPFFLILLVVLAASAAERQNFGTYARGRARRLLQPWLEWSLLYGALKLAEVAVTGAPLTSEFKGHMILTGPALHLWFLPFAFVACLLVHPLIRFGATQQGTARSGLLSIGLVVLGLASLALQQDHRFSAPLAQWIYALPAVFLGLALGLTGNRLVRVCALVSGFVLCAAMAGWTSGLLQISLAGGMLALCMALPCKTTPLSHWAGQAAMGIYLAHPLVLSLLQRLTDMATDSLTMAALTCLGALAVSAAASCAFRAVRAAIPPSRHTLASEGTHLRNDRRFRAK